MKFFFSSSETNKKLLYLFFLPTHHWERMTIRKNGRYKDIGEKKNQLFECDSRTIENS